MENMTTLRVSPQGQITIPKGWQKLLHLKPGTKLVVSLIDLIKTKALVLKPEPKSWTEEVVATGKGLWGNSDQYIQKERSSWNK